MLFCKNCIYFERVNVYYNCNRLRSTKIDMVTGHQAGLILNAYDERQNKDRCGPEAKFFKQKKFLGIF